MTILRLANKDFILMIVPTRIIKIFCFGKISETYLSIINAYIGIDNKNVRCLQHTAYSVIFDMSKKMNYIRFRTTQLNSAAPASWFRYCHGCTEFTILIALYAIKLNFISPY